jgi:predicted nucleic acid-binding protein
VEGNIGVRQTKSIPARLLAFAAYRRFEMLVSDRLLDELRGVLLRPRFRRYLSAPDAEGFVNIVSGDRHLHQPPKNCPSGCLDRQTSSRSWRNSRR